MNLIVVESPTKAKTFLSYLDSKQYKVVSSMGHVRDLPIKKLGIDLEHNFEPQYEIIANKAKTIKEIVKESKKAQKIILATDQDREGEAIAFHLEYVLKEKLKKKVNFERIIFHEITKQTLLDALTKPRKLNQKLFDAQQARRVVDRLVGYQISPYLWKRYSKSWLSAGRVQTVVLRFIVEREKEREKFKEEKYYIVKGLFMAKTELPVAKLTKLKGKPFFIKKTFLLFDGQYEYQISLLKDQSKHDQEITRLRKEQYIVQEVIESVYEKKPPPPFITSSLQQFAGSYLSFTPKRTMRIAQSLYEKGLITYHRTDSYNLSSKFVSDCRQYIKKQYGQEYLAQTPRIYKKKSKLAQEAHEAIRPTSLTNNPEKNKVTLNSAEKRLYSIIYYRSLATQMRDAQMQKQKIVISSKTEDVFVIEAEKVKVEGYLITRDKEGVRTNVWQTSLKKGDQLKLKELSSEFKETQPPPRYTEATIIKTLEAKGIGRPSTYAPIVALVLERQYVFKKERKLVPSNLGISVSDLLTDKFAELFQIDFTASMEDRLDTIALGETQWQTVVQEYYKPLSNSLKKASKDTSKIRIEETTKEKCPDCGHALVIKISRFGRFFACSNFPDCRYTKSFLEKAGVKCPQCKSGEIIIRFSRKKRRFYACDRYPKCDYTSLWLPKDKSKPLNSKN